MAVRVATPGTSMRIVRYRIEVPAGYDARFRGCGHSLTFAAQGG